VRLRRGRTVDAQLGFFVLLCFGEPLLLNMIARQAEAGWPRAEAAELQIWLQELFAAMRELSPAAKADRHFCGFCGTSELVP